MNAQLPIVQYWDAAKPPDYIAELTSSFARFNPDRRHILFNAQTADDFIAENFTGRESAAFRACGPAAMQADYLRYCAVLHLGGVWADAGLLCVQNLGTLLEASQGGELFRAFVSSSMLGNSLFAFAVPRHPFLRLAVDLSTELIERRWKGKVNEITGPLLMTAIHGLHRAGSMDAFLEEAQKETQGSPHLLDYFRLVCDLIGDYDRAAEACAGVGVSPARDRSNWVCSPDGELPHRSAKSHWSHLGSNVYVNAPRPQRTS